MPFLTQGKTNWKFLLIVVILVVIVGGGIFAYQYWWLPKEEAKNIQKPVVCTQEAKICPGGSTVGRTGPNCEFAECPTVKTDETADWQTYRNEEVGFSFKYPNDPNEWGDLEEESRLYGEGVTGRADNLNEVSVSLLVRHPPFNAGMDNLSISYITPTFIIGRELSEIEMLAGITEGENWVEKACGSDILKGAATYYSCGIIVSCINKKINDNDVIEYTAFGCSCLGCETMQSFRKAVIFKTASKKFPTLVFSTGFITDEIDSKTAEGKTEIENIVKMLNTKIPTISTDNVDQEEIDLMNGFDNIIKTVKILE